MSPRQTWDQCSTILLADIAQRPNARRFCVNPPALQSVPCNASRFHASKCVASETHGIDGDTRGAVEATHLQPFHLHPPPQPLPSPTPHTTPPIHPPALRVMLWVRWSPATAGPAAPLRLQRSKLSMRGIVPVRRGEDSLDWDNRDELLFKVCLRGTGCTAPIGAAAQPRRRWRAASGACGRIVVPED